MRRVMLIGLDCVPPVLAFDRYRELMPALSALIAEGSHGPLRSTVPPITVPAWTCMVSGRDPGELGLYGFRQRQSGRYDLRMVSSEDVKVDRVWDVLALHDRRSSVLFVPPSTPVGPVEGEQVGCFLTPGPDSPHAYPAPLQGELRVRFGPYIPDVEGFRDGASEALLERLLKMTEQHFAIARHVWDTRQPDLMMMVEIGPDRLHHAFWRHMDPRHPDHDPTHELVDAGERYYAFLDQQIELLLRERDDQTAVIVASDHGARAMHGAFRINEWLIEQGWLHLHTEPEAPGPLRMESVDWSRTRAWAEGGYYARVCLNVCGREPRGCIAPEDLETELQALRDQLASICGPDGRRWKNSVFRPSELYREVEGVAPDLIAIFDELSWRPVSSVGHGTLHGRDESTGLDGCNHDMDGIFVVAGTGVGARGLQSGCVIQDVGVTALALLGVERPAGWLGTDRSGASEGGKGR